MALLVLASSCSAASGPAGGDWRSYTLNPENSRLQAQSTITARNVGRLRLSWMLPTDRAVTSTPVVVAGSVFFADWGGDVYSVNVATGHVRWKVNLKNPVSSTLAVQDGRVFIALSPEDTAAYPPHDGDRVVVLSQATGRLIWSRRFASSAQGVWGSPTIYDGMVYVGAAGGIGQQEAIPPFVGGTVVAMDEITGKLIWQRTLNGSAGGAGLWGSVAASPELDEIFLATANSYSDAGTLKDAYSVVSLNPRTGKENWRYRAYPNLAKGSDDDFGATPNVFNVDINGRTRLAVGIGSKDGYYYTLDARTGLLLRKTLVQPKGGVIGNASVIAGPTVTDVFVPTYEDSLDVSNPDVCCGSLVSLDVGQSKIRWYVPVDANVIGSSSLIPGAALFGDAKGNVYAISIATGKTLFHVALPDSVQAGITPAEGHLFVATCKGDPTPGYGDPKMPRSGLGVYAYGL